MNSNSVYLRYGGKITTILLQLIFFSLIYSTSQINRNNILYAVLQITDNDLPLQPASEGAFWFLELFVFDFPLGGCFAGLFGVRG